MFAAPVSEHSPSLTSATINNPPTSRKCRRQHFSLERKPELMKNCPSLASETQNHPISALPPGRKTRNGDLKEEWCKAVYWNDQTNTYMLDLLFQKIRGIPKSGLDETWEASYNTGTIGVKTTNLDFMAFNAAVAYNPGSYRLARIEMVPAVVHRLAVHLCRIRLRRSGSGNLSTEEL